MKNSIKTSEQTKQVFKKKWLLWIGVGGGVIALAIIGSNVWAQNQKEQFVIDAGNYQQRVAREFKELNEQPQSTEAYKQYLHSHEAALTAIVASQPKPPKLLWITAAPSDSAKRTTDISKAAGDLRDAMANYHEFLVFRDGTLETVRNSGGTISTIDQLRETKTRLLANQQVIKALRPPRGLEAYQHAKVALYDKPLATMETAIVAYDKNDLELYDDKVVQLAQEVKTISLLTTAQELLNMHQYYDAMSKAYDALDKLLNK